jgi:hypothetical protein
MISVFVFVQNFKNVHSKHKLTLTRADLMKRFGR